MATPNYGPFSVGDLVAYGSNTYLVIPPCVYRERLGSGLYPNQIAVKYLDLGMYHNKVFAGDIASATLVKKAEYV